MVRSINSNKKEELLQELKSDFPNIQAEDFKNMNDSVDELVNTLSLKVGKDRQEVEKIVESKLEWINSKHLL